MAVTGSDWTRNLGMLDVAAVDGDVVTLTRTPGHAGNVPSQALREWWASVQGRDNVLTLVRWLVEGRPDRSGTPRPCNITRLTFNMTTIKAGQPFTSGGGAVQDWS